MVTLLLNILCDKGLGVVSWIIVFIPFILMTVIVSMILYVFGLDAATGKFNYKCDDDSKNKCGEGISIDSLGNIVIYDPNYNPNQYPVYYQKPNLIVPNPKNYTQVYKPLITNLPLAPTGSSSPEYKS
jgi:hypothetical protein